MNELPSSTASILPCRDLTPQLHPSCWVAPHACIIGDVQMGAQSTVWFQAVVRGDVAPIRIGSKVNIQDGAIIHGTFEKSATHIDDGASIGHRAIVHGAHVGEGALIGMGAIIMDGVVIGKGAVVAAGAVVLAGTQIPPKTLWAGVPATDRGFVRKDLQIELAATAERYVHYAQWFQPDTN